MERIISSYVYVGVDAFDFIGSETMTSEDIPYYMPYLEKVCLHSFILICASQPLTQNKSKWINIKIIILATYMIYAIFALIWE